MIGEIGNGKSSLINTIITALSDFNKPVCLSVPAGKSGQSYTRSKKEYNIFGDNPIKLVDIWGWQLNTGFKGFENLVVGKLRDNCEESKADDDHQTGFSSYNKPQACITVCDIYSVNDPDKMAKFGYYYNKLKQDYGIPTVVVLTKLDIIHPEEDEEDLILKNNINKIYDCNIVNDILDKFSKGTKIPRGDVFLVVNYEGENDQRSLVKDYLALRLLEKIIIDIEDNYKHHYKFIQVVDQSNKIIGAVPIKSSDLTLSDFEETYFKRFKSDNKKGFYPTHFYKADGETPLPDEENHNEIMLEDLVQKEMPENDRYVVYQLKVHNKLNDSNVPIIKRDMSTLSTELYVSIQDSIDQMEPEVTRVKIDGKETLKSIREILDLSDKLVFSKKSIGEEGIFQRNMEGRILVRQAVDSKSTLYAVSEFPAKRVKEIY